LRFDDNDQAQWNEECGACWLSFDAVAHFNHFEMNCRRVYIKKFSKMMSAIDKKEDINGK
jgi:hypothetical protein